MWHLMVKEMWAGKKLADDHKVRGWAACSAHGRVKAQGLRRGPGSTGWVGCCGSCDPATGQCGGAAVEGPGLDVGPSWVFRARLAPDDPPPPATSQD